MSKKDKKSKKVNPKRERYAKFRKTKSTDLTLTMPDLNDNQVKQTKIDEQKIEKFLRFSRNPQTKTINPRKMKSKR